MTRLFSEYQVARFNELYYQRRSNWLRRWTTGASIVSAVAASAVLASLLKDGFGLGPSVWQVVTGLAAASAAIGPILGWEGKASQLEKAALGYGFVRDRLRHLLNDLKLSELDDTHVARAGEIRALVTALTALDETASSARLKEICWKQTMDELPSEQAWNLV